MFMFKKFLYYAKNHKRKKNYHKRTGESYENYEYRKTQRKHVSRPHRSRLMSNC